MANDQAAFSLLSFVARHPGRSERGEARGRYLRWSLGAVMTELLETVSNAMARGFGGGMSLSFGPCESPNGTSWLLETVIRTPSGGLTLLFPSGLVRAAAASVSAGPSESASDDELTAVFLHGMIEMFAESPLCDLCPSELESVARIPGGPVPEAMPLTLSIASGRFPFFFAASRELQAKLEERCAVVRNARRSFPGLRRPGMRATLWFAGVCSNLLQLSEARAGTRVEISPEARLVLRGRAENGRERVLGGRWGTLPGSDGTVIRFVCRAEI